MTARENHPRGSANTRGKRPRERRVFLAGAVSAIRALDAAGARYVCTIGDTEGVVSAELIARYHLSAGREISEATASELTREAHVLQVFDQAVGLLAVRARSARELGLALRRRDASDSEAQVAIARLAELGLIDDASFAKNVVRTKIANEGVSKRRLQVDLARRGVEREVARAAIGEIVAESGLDEFEAALSVGRRRMRALGGLDRLTVRRRLYAFLARRGYESVVVSNVVAALSRVAAPDESESV